MTSLAIASFCLLLLRLGVDAVHAGGFSLMLGLSAFFYSSSSQFEVYSATTLWLCVALLGMARTEAGETADS